MIVKCDKCKAWFEDIYRSTVCPHDAFLANDGNNAFMVRTDSLIVKPVKDKENRNGSY